MTKAKIKNKKSSPTTCSSLTAFNGFLTWLCTLYALLLPVLQSNVSALIDMKLEKYKNLREESAFFWGEIAEGTLKFDRKEAEVCTL